MTVLKSPKPLARNSNPVRLKDLSSLGSMLAPGLLFLAALCVACLRDQRFDWIARPARHPWELWVIAVAGAVATFGGIADWLFHRTFLTVGPAEHRSHLLALATGGIPLFFLMIFASALDRPGLLLLPVLVVVLWTTSLICFDEFAFHRHRCRPLETLFHRLLVFGNGIAWLAWMNWCFVRGGVHA